VKISRTATIDFGAKEKTGRSGAAPAKTGASIVKQMNP